MQKNAQIDFDELNVYINTKIPTSTFLKIVLSIFNYGAFFGLFYFAAILQVDKPNIFPFILIIGYFFTMGKYLFWNIYGEENYIISSTHISYKHNYGFWKTKLKTFEYDKVELLEEEPSKSFQLNFTKFNKQKLPVNVFYTTIPLNVVDGYEIWLLIENLKIQDLNMENKFPPINVN